MGTWARALEFFYSTYPDDEIKKIFLSGGGAHIEELTTLLAQEASTPVERISPFDSLAINTERIDTSYLDKIAPQAAICLGLSLRRIDDK